MMLLLAAAFLMIAWGLIAALRNSLDLLGRTSLERLAAELEEKGRPQLRQFLSRRMAHALLQQTISSGLVVASAVCLAVWGLGRSAAHPAAAVLWAGAVTAAASFVVAALARWAAAWQPEKVLLALRPWVRAFEAPFLPVVLPVAAALERVYQRFRADMRVRLEQDDSRMEDAIEAYIGEGQREGLLEADEGRMIQGLLELSDTTARSIMTPRTDMLSVPESTTVGGLCAELEGRVHSRIPVYRRDPDEITGIVYVKDVLPVLAEGPAGAQRELRELARPPYVVPETKPVQEILADFQKEHVQIAVVVDEYGSVAGLLTIEDIVEEIVGELHEKASGSPHLEGLRHEGDHWEAAGGASVHDLETALGRDIGADGPFNSVAGWLVHHAGRIPAAGEKLLVRGLRVTVVEADGRKVARVRVRESRAAAPAPGSSGSV